MKDDNNYIRAFIAISLPKEIKTFLHDLQIQLRISGIRSSRVSWAKPEMMHLTLKFLGNVKISRLDTIKSCMRLAVTGIPTHTLSAAGVGVFPSIKKARVIWSGTRGQTDVLERLSNRLDDIIFDELGIKKNTARFSPHLTVARIKKPIFPKTIIQLLHEFQDYCSNDFLVSEIKLIQSRLTSSGAIHKIIFSAPF